MAVNGWEMIPMGKLSQRCPLHLVNGIFGCVRNSWCDPFKTWQKVSLSRRSHCPVGVVTLQQSYTFDPLAGLTETETKLVLGGLVVITAPPYY